MRLPATITDGGAEPDDEADREERGRDAIARLAPGRPGTVVATVSGTSGSPRSTSFSDRAERRGPRGSRLRPRRSSRRRGAPRRTRGPSG